jgi:hypothetical protein
MEQVAAITPSGTLPKVILFVVLFVALYYLYTFLTSNSGLQGNTILNAISSATPGTPYTATGDGLPAVYEGGELSLNTWVYINDYSVNRGQNKHVISIGGGQFLTCLVYLGPYKNVLSVRVQTTPPSTAAGSAVPTSSDVDLRVTTVNSMFGTVVNENSLLEPSSACDINSVDMQKWVQVTVTLNNKTCDVYLDGKLSRSCILPSFFRVDRSNMKLSVCDHGGFGGFVSNVSAYNYALNPEQIWNLYMNGPGPQYSVMQYITSLFSPSSAMQLDYPKKNIIP